MTPASSILICSVPRSGSWLLAEGLEATGLGGRPREYFRPDYEPIYRSAWGLPAASDFTNYLDAVLLAGTTPNAVFGVKLHWGQFTHLAGKLEHMLPRRLDPAASLAAAFPRPTYVFLCRSNKAEQAVSLYRAMLVDQWWEFSEDAQPDHAALVAHEPHLHHIAKLETSLTEDELSWRSYFARSGVKPLILRYEDLAENYRQTLRGLFRRLPIDGMDRAAVDSPRLRRQADRISASWLEKYLLWKARSNPAASTPAREPGTADRR